MIKLDRHEVQTIFVMFFVLPVIGVGGTLLYLACRERTPDCRPGFVEVRPGICVIGYDTKKVR